MAKPQRLEFETTRRERLESRVQRIGWTTVGVVLLAGATGLLGGGGLSRRTMHGPANAYSVTFERVQRVHAVRHMEWRAVPEDGQLTVEIAGQNCADITPQDGTAPAHTEVTAVGRRFVFRARTRETATVTLDLQPVRSGGCVLRARANDAEWLEIPMFVLP